jgi:hypothetical protein
MDEVLWTFIAYGIFILHVVQLELDILGHGT